MRQQLIMKLFEGLKGRAVPSVGICKILTSDTFRGSRKRCTAAASSVRSKGARPLPPYRDAGHTAARLLRVPAHDRKLPFKMLSKA